MKRNEVEMEGVYWTGDHTIHMLMYVDDKTNWGHSSIT